MQLMQPPITCDVDRDGGFVADGVQGAAGQKAACHKLVEPLLVRVPVRLACTTGRTDVLYNARFLWACHKLIEPLLSAAAAAAAADPDPT